MLIFERKVFRGGLEAFVFAWSFVIGAGPFFKVTSGLAQEKTNPPASDETKSVEVDSQKFYFAASVRGGSGTSGSSGLNHEVNTVVWGGALHTGLRVFKYFTAGVVSDFSYTGQVSDVDSSVGNRRGTRWNSIAPEFGFQKERFWGTVQFQFLGNYVLLNSSNAGATITYREPFGYRVSLLYAPFKFVPKARVGIFYDQVTFKREQNTLTGETEIDGGIAFKQGGLLVHFLF